MSKKDQSALYNSLLQAKHKDLVDYFFTLFEGRRRELWEYVPTSPATQPTEDTY